MANLAFNTAGVDTSDNFSPIPAGDYNVMVVESDILDTKAGTGTYIKLQMKVLDGPHANRVLFHNIPVTNPNQTAVEIGQKHLAQLCQAAGLAAIADTQDLHNKPVTAKVKVKKDPEYGDSNEVLSYKPVTGGVATPAAAPTQQQTQAAPAQNTPPWNQ